MLERVKWISTPATILVVLLLSWHVRAEPWASNNRLMAQEELVFASSSFDIGERDPHGVDASSPAPQQVQPHGVKSFLVKKAAQLIALSFCKGGDVLAYILQWLDDDAATAVSVYGMQIGAALDDIANIPGLTVKIVREKLLHFLMSSAGLSGGVALQIADAVAATIDWLVL